MSWVYFALDMITCTWDWIADHATVLSAVVSAIATVVVAWFTIRLTGATKGQLALLGETVALSRDEFNATFQPRLSVRFVRNTNKKGANMVEFTIENIGHRPAQVMGAAFYAGHISQYSLPLPYDLEPNEIVSGRRFMPGATDLYSIQLDTNRKVFPGIKTGEESNLILLGWLAYTDIVDGVPNQDGIKTIYVCRKYVSAHGQFLPIAQWDSEKA